MSKNISKGDRLEKSISKVLHTPSSTTPVLVSSLVLRELNCGQIDLCCYKRNKIYLYEVKSKPEGISKQQYLRLNKSLQLLAEIFNAQGQIIIKSHCQKI